MENKEIEINTIQDIVDKVPTERIDLFLKDLKEYILLAKSFSKVIPSLTNLKMKWIDDDKTGLNKVNVTIITDNN